MILDDECGPEGLSMLLKNESTCFANELSLEVTRDLLKLHYLTYQQSLALS